MKYRQVWKKKIGSEPCSVGVEKWDWIDGTEVSHLTPLQFQLGFGNTFYFHTPKKMFISSCNLHIHWSVLKKGKPIIMWCSKPATWTRDSLSDSSFFLFLTLRHLLLDLNRVPHEHPWRHVRTVRQVLPQRPRPPEALEDSRHPEGTRLPGLRKRLLDLHQAKWAPQSSHRCKAIPGMLTIKTRIDPSSKLKWDFDEEIFPFNHLSVWRRAK